MSDVTVKLRRLFSNESTDDLISNRGKFLLAFPAMPVTIGNILIHNAYIKYYSDEIGLDVGFVGVTYFIFGIWNAINDPMMGVVIDCFRYTHKRGKYVYFMRVTAPLIVISSFPMLFAQPSWNEWVIIVGSQFSNLSQRPMLGTIIDQDEQQTDMRKAGSFTELNALLTIPVSGIQAAIFTTLISRYGFVSGDTVQSSRALTGIRIGAGAIPFFFVLLGIIPIFFSPIDRVKEKELPTFAELLHRFQVQNQQ